MLQVVVPMSGFGERFRRAGYAVPKPLIEVAGRPIIGHVVDMFPGVTDFIFVCSRAHLEDDRFRMREILEELCPTGKIVSIEPHKLGPVHAALQAVDLIDPDRPLVVNYCDFTCVWDFDHFQRTMEALGCDGAIPCYTGFHPHMLESTSYAYVRETGGWVSEIQEKRPYTAAPMSEYASSGTYYFRTGRIALDYCRKTIEEGLRLNGEYYASLVFTPMLRDGLRVAVYPLAHFMQWGTPDDLRDYLHWDRVFRGLIENDRPVVPQAGNLIMPMAGAGSRFATQGYAQPKPLIEVSGLPMAVQAALDLPQADQRTFVLRSDLSGLEQIKAALFEAFPQPWLPELREQTDGQARTCLAAMGGVDNELPLSIGACDNGVVYQRDDFDRMMADEAIDVIVWVARGHPNAARRPHMYSWVDADGACVKAVSVKQPLSDPSADPIVIGTFTFKKARHFRSAAGRMIAREGKVNGEYYVDACINDALAMGLRCAVLEADTYLCWGTPDELKTFEYWQSCFHKWSSHPYRLELDSRVPQKKVFDLAKRFALVAPAIWTDA